MHIASKKMQKMAANNNTLDKMKRILRGFCFFFAISMLGLYIYSGAAAVVFCMFWCLCTMVAWPVGAMYLNQMMTGLKSSGSCCGDLCHFLKLGVQPALCDRRSKERQDQINGADPNNSAGKFLLTRLRMAEMIEKTCIRVWIAMFCYIFAGLYYVAASAAEVDMPAGPINSVHFAVILIFFPLHCGMMQVFFYIKFTLRGMLAPKDNGSKVSAGLSMKQSSTRNSTVDTSTKEDGSPPPGERPLSPPPGEKRVAPAP